MEKIITQDVLHKMKNNSAQRQRELLIIAKL